MKCDLISFSVVKDFERFEELFLGLNRFFT
ncbi:hypothetical protein OCH239_05325 [Roseivivax halodurans JCM 10272]|uniref:Uncharacterized protein n=1 Tax=Roseivivax halodurans JCM 10272 TaxID=1449350 RepID=X7EDQ3_9RHOB|nr:hypothetical protein OCH239_05325 [Roseivivax halodurans JCM 10272]